MDDEELLRLLEELDIIPPSSKDSDERTTPDNLFKPLDKEFHFTLDPCSTHENAKCKRHYTREENGLLQSWRDEIVFMNSPYSNIHSWLHKAVFEFYHNNATIICILPCDTSTEWFHTYIWSRRNHCSIKGVQLRFPRGRFKFGKYTTSPMFATIIAVFNSASNLGPNWDKKTIDLRNLRSNVKNLLTLADKDDLDR